VSPLRPPCRPTGPLVDRLRRDAVALRVFIGPRPAETTVRTCSRRETSLFRSPPRTALDWHNRSPDYPDQTSSQRARDPRESQTRKSPADRAFVCSSGKKSRRLRGPSRSAPVLIAPSLDPGPGIFVRGVYPMLIVFKGVSACLNHSSLFKVNYSSPSASSLIGQSLYRHRPSQGSVCSRGIRSWVFLFSGRGGGERGGTEAERVAPPFPRRLSLPPPPSMFPDVAVRLRAI